MYLADGRGRGGSVGPLSAADPLGPFSSLVKGTCYVIELYFSDYFEVSPRVLHDYGAFNISLITDLPLFIDPFLLFNSDKPEYQSLHEEIIDYLRFLRDKSVRDTAPEPLMRAWYCFGEIKQNWLGFSGSGNRGRGLGLDFARSLNANLFHLFRDFGSERVTKGSHLEKLTLIRSGVGRDMISDFTTNLIKDYLLGFTEQFAIHNLNSKYVRGVSVPRAYFSYRTERWMPKHYKLPWCHGDFVMLTPKDILTKDDTWISRRDMCDRFESIPDAVPDAQLRTEINNYFYSMIPQGHSPSKKDYLRAKEATLIKYPELIDYYIRTREDEGEEAIDVSSLKVRESELLYIQQFGALARLLETMTAFYGVPGTTKEETAERIAFLKDVIENKGGYRLFFGSNGNPIRRESDLHILFRLVWGGTLLDVSREVNDGRGPADYKISYGAFDKTLVEFKLASNTQLRRNLEKQLDIYKKASDATAGFKVIVYFSEEELVRVRKILQELEMSSDTNVVLIDARADNKPSASKA